MTIYTLNDLLLYFKEHNIPKDKENRFKSFISYKGLSNPDTDIIEFYKTILTSPAEFKNLNNSRWKDVKTKKNIVSAIKTIWELPIFKTLVEEEEYNAILDELKDFYSHLKITDESDRDSIIQKQDSNNILEMTELLEEPSVPEDDDKLEIKRLNELVKVLHTTIKNLTEAVRISEKI
jgi:ribonuclease D